ncbi:vesicular glutamate transporter 3 [Plakobranchus ocellatus]|uniref:Vesicular glutamate transporter 3 n=1 Tax=Plakobranchus ocellatus TaxID=259542 RepID=A0AAV3ZD81_9GAST|nr:vesicular glutamate transporter 3 [Plakobranchus ocellatus]
MAKALKKSVNDPLYDDTYPLLHKIEEGKTKQPEKPKGFGARHTLTLWAFLGFVNLYAMRVNLSVAMVAMVNSNSTSESNASVGLQKNDEDEGEFNWNEETQGKVLGAFFYGYLVSQVPGGWLATRFGGKRVFGLGMLLTSILTLLTPVAARSSVYLLMAVRVVEGLGEGVVFPAMHSLLGVWAPLYERSMLAVITYSGTDLGTVITMPISGLLCDSDILGGWPSVFYIMGAVSLLWSICWLAFVYDSPAQHPSISKEERAYIEASIGKSVSPGRPPWGKIFASSAMWAIVVAQTANNWGLYVFLTCLPTYMKQILKFNMKGSRFCVYLVCPLALDSDAVQFFTVCRIHNTCCATSVLCETTTCILLGISNTFAAIPGFVSPLLVGALTNNNQTRGQWQIVFYITSVIYVLGAVVYIFLAQGEALPWGQLSSATTDAPGSTAINETDTEEEPEKKTSKA